MARQPPIACTRHTRTGWRSRSRPRDFGSSRAVAVPGPRGTSASESSFFHGVVLGASHPDALAKRPVAVLFDEKDGIARYLAFGTGHPISLVYGDAYSGGKALAATSAGTTSP